MKMRGIYNSVTDIRRKVFTEVARLAYEGGDYSRIDTLPYKIVPGKVAVYRESIFLERLSLKKGFVLLSDFRFVLSTSMSLFQTGLRKRLLLKSITIRRL